MIKLNVDFETERRDCEFSGDPDTVLSELYAINIAIIKEVAHYTSTPEEKIYTQMSDFLLKEISVPERLN